MDINKNEHDLRAFMNYRRMRHIKRCNNWPVICPEDVAQHSYYTTLLAIILANEYNQSLDNQGKSNQHVNVNTVATKALLHDLDNIPVYNPEQPYMGEFSGKRIKRGLYRFSNGKTANADLNGAANILRKSKQKFDYERLCRGLLASPLRIRSHTA